MCGGGGLSNYSVSFDAAMVLLKNCLKNWFNFQVLDDGRVVYVVGEDNLGLAINMESQLASHASSSPAINFLAYVPSR